MPNLTSNKEEILATLWYAETHVQLIEDQIAKVPYELSLLQEELKIRAQRADEQVKGIHKMMVYGNLLIQATLGYKKNRASDIDYINEVVVLKADADLLVQCG